MQKKKQCQCHACLLCLLLAWKIERMKKSGQDPSKDARKAADALHYINMKKKNPNRAIFDKKGRKVNMASIDAGKAAALLGFHSQQGATLAEAEQAVHSKIVKLLASGKKEEEGAAFKHEDMRVLEAQRLTMDAGRDAKMGWSYRIAALSGLRFTKEGPVFIHSDGSVALVSEGKVCKCGFTHI